jgi:hypothetical protein
VLLTNDQVNFFGGNMGSLMEVTLRTAVIGIGATAIMDIWFVVLKTLKVPILILHCLGGGLDTCFMANGFILELLNPNLLKMNF